MTPLETAIQKVHAAGAAGLSFANLDIEEQEYLTAGLVPEPGRPFDDTTRALLSGYVLLVPDAFHAALELATSDLPHKFGYRTLKDGSRCVSSDVLTWCGDADPLGFLRPTLHQLPIRAVSPSDFESD